MLREFHKPINNLCGPFPCSQSILVIGVGVGCDVAVGEVVINGDVGDSNLPLITWPCSIFRMYIWLLRMWICLLLVPEVIRDLRSFKSRNSVRLSSGDMNGLIEI